MMGLYLNFGRLFLSRNFLVLVAISILAHAQSGLLHWLGPYLTGTAGGPAVLGLTYTLVMVLAATALVFGGVLADSLGRKRTIVSMYFLRLAAAFVAVAAGLRLDVFIVLVLVYEASKFVLRPASSALLYESVDRKVVGRALSLLSVAGAIVQGVAASVAGYLLTWGVFSHVLFTTAVGAFLLTLLLTETVERRVASLSEAVAEFARSLRGIPVYLAKKDIVGAVAASALIEFSGFIAWLLLPLLLAVRGLSVEEIGLVVGVSLIARRIGITVAGFVIDRLGPLPAMAVDAVSTGLLFAAIAVVKDPWLASLLFIVEEFFVMSGLAFRMHVMSVVEKRYRASVLGSSLALVTLITVPAPMIGSMLYSVDPSLPFLASGLGLVTVGSLIAIVRPRTGRSG